VEDTFSFFPFISTSYTALRKKEGRTRVIPSRFQDTTDVVQDG